MMSHPARGAWIEMRWRSYTKRARKSHPARGAWIEIDLIVSSAFCDRVAPRKGCVD